jgi:hypothetical protein
LNNKTQLRDSKNVASTNSKGNDKKRNIKQSETKINLKRARVSNNPPSSPNIQENHSNKTPKETTNQANENTHNNPPSSSKQQPYSSAANQQIEYEELQSIIGVKCKISYSTNFNLKKHHIVQHLKKKFDYSIICKHCDKKFNDKSNFNKQCRRLKIQTS